MELVFLLCFVALEKWAVPLEVMLPNSSSLCLKTQVANCKLVSGWISAVENLGFARRYT